jgi:DNA transformation protein
MGPRPTVKQGKAKDAFAERCERLLAPLGPVEARRMFGGYGLFLDGLMIALIAGGTLYLKADEDSREDFAAAGSTPFRYKKKDRWYSMSYWQAPAGSLDGAEVLLPWAERALAAARRAARSKKRRASN